MRYQPTECILTEDELCKLCAEWQETLRLQDWDVRVEIVRGREIDDKRGRCLWQATCKQAIIRLIDPEDDDASPGFPLDMEEVLVHELLHLSHAGCSPDEGTPEDTALEQAINATSRALVALKRACEGDTTITVHEDAGFDVQSDDGTTGEVAVLNGWGPDGPIIEDRRAKLAKASQSCPEEWRDQGGAI